MSNLARYVNPVKSYIARAIVEMEVTYYCKITNLISELDPEELTNLMSDFQQGDVLQVTLQIAIKIFLNVRLG
jgi:hypothetical protein